MSSQLDRLDPVVDGAVLESIAAGLRHPGYLVIYHALPEPVLDGLAGTFDRLDDHDFAQAGVGRDDDHRRLDRVRGDRIRWLDPQDATSAWYFAWVESLRLGLNRSLFLGLFDYECHLAWYPPGSFYRTHLDAFRGRENRKVSTVLYLNRDWRPSDGGELVIHHPDGASTELILTPTWGTMVLFLSEEFPHEVLTSSADRRSLAGWFRVNSPESNHPLPPLLPDSLGSRT